MRAQLSAESGNVRSSYLFALINEGNGAHCVGFVNATVFVSRGAQHTNKTKSLRAKPLSNCDADEKEEKRNC